MLEPVVSQLASFGELNRHARKAKLFEQTVTCCRSTASDAAKTPISAACVGPSGFDATMRLSRRCFGAERHSGSAPKINRPRKPFSPRRKLLTGSMLPFVEIFWPYGLTVAIAVV